MIVLTTRCIITHYLLIEFLVMQCLIMCLHVVLIAASLHQDAVTCDLICFSHILIIA